MSNKMLPSGISVRIREDLADGVSRTQTTLIVDPLVTIGGHRMTMADMGDIAYGKINQGKSSEEIVSWTGITDNTTTYTLTGCVWGINFHNLSNDSANVKRHVSGSQFAIMTDMHYIADQFVSADDFNVNDNAISWGDGTDTDKTLEARNGDTNKPFMRYESATNKWVFSNDGVNTYDPSAGGSGLTAGDGIDLVAGAITADANELMGASDSGLTVTGNRVNVKNNEAKLMMRDATGIYPDITDSPYEAQIAGYLTGDTANLNAVIGLFDANSITTEQTLNINITFGGTSWNGQTIVSGANGYLEKVAIECYRGSSTAGNFDVNIYAVDVNDKPTGSVVHTVSMLASALPASTDSWFDININYQLTPNTRYAVHFSAPSAAGIGNDYVNISISENANDFYGGCRISSSNSGTTWSTHIGEQLAMKSYWAGDNDGKFSINIDSVDYNDVAIDLSNLGSSVADARCLRQNSTQPLYGVNYTNQSFTTTAYRDTLDVVTLYFTKTGTPSGNLNLSIYLSDGNDKPTGSAISTISVLANSIQDSQLTHFTFGTKLSISTKYCLVLSVPSGDASNKLGVAFYSSGSIYSGGKFGSSGASGSTWAMTTSYDSYFVAYFSSSIDLVAAKLQASIRAVTSGSELVTYDTDHFIITSGTRNRDSSVLKLISPSTGTDMSGTGYLNMGVNGVETQGLGSENQVARTDDYGFVLSNKEAPTTAGQVVALGSDNKLPAVDGGNLTGLNVFKSGVTTKDIYITGDQTIAHGLGSIPKRVRIIANLSVSSGVCWSHGTYNGTTQTVIWYAQGSSMTSNIGTSASKIIHVTNANSVDASATIVIDATNITLTWSKSGSPTGTANIMWEVEN